MNLYGEVFAMWSNVLSNNGAIAGAEEENKQLKAILKSNGVALPPAPPERPDARRDDIPPGARFNDPEISAKLSADVAAGLVACSTAMGMSTREDIAFMYGQFHMAKAQLGGKLLRLNKNKGWLVPPPLQISPHDA